MHRSTDELRAQLPTIESAPTDAGSIAMIVRRPGEDAREVVQTAKLDVDGGLVGDNWLARGNPHMPDGAADPEAQITIMNSRVTEAVAGGRERWPLAGDQIYVDMNLSMDNIPAGTRLTIGDAVVEISAKPHTGCDKFAARFGAEALRFVNVGEGKTRRYRGVNARVVEGGSFSTGDQITKV